MCIHAGRHRNEELQHEQVEEGILTVERVAEKMGSWLYTGDTKLNKQNDNIFALHEVLYMDMSQRTPSF